MNTLQAGSASFDHRNRAALLCIESPHIREIISGQLNQLGFGIHTATNAEEALHALYSQDCDVVVIAEDYEGTDIKTHPVLTEIGNMPIKQRRLLFLTLMGPDLTTQSERQAFTLSADLVIHPQDIPNFKTLISQGIQRHKELYAPLKAALRRFDEEGLL